MGSDEVIRKGLRELSKDLASGALTSSAVTEASLARIDHVQRTSKPYALPLPALARTLAKESDVRRARGQVRGPLDGVPLALAESVDLAGHASTLGMALRRGHTAHRDAVVVALLREGGAVFLGKTNLGAELLRSESDNPVYGRSSNPFAATRSPGESSLGAAIAAGASPGGIAVDLAGSLRTSCAWTGICGLKPTTDRWSNLGSNTARAGRSHGQLGPMARTVDDLAVLLEVITPQGCARSDPRTAPLPIPSYGTVDVTALRVGWFVDGLVPPSPAVVRGVRSAVEAVAASGAHVEPYLPLLVEDAVFAYLARASAGVARPSRPLHRDVARKARATVRGFTGERHLGRLLKVMGDHSATELDLAITRAHHIAAETLAMWERLDLDVVLCPVHATPAVKHHTPPDFVLAGSPALFWSAVGFPAGVVPVTTVRASETAERRGAGRLAKWAAEVDEGSAGLPIGVQVVARPFHEEHVLAAMAVIERAVAGEEGFPRLAF